eukprot:TRINITY_DN7154_c1_g1_i1.p1 TRINITY_DN7154_c1_g1~~TRINITY_DN7154_c1_g1_i1.p1  ORF type:complete len:593 (-),score=201.07 TRINITY_DN7154_c1_g1_i1:126-1904(-)
MSTMQPAACGHAALGSSYTVGGSSGSSSSPFGGRGRSSSARQQPMEDGGGLQQFRDAEMSVDYLCQRLELLGQQLWHEERARAAAEELGAQLAAEVHSAEEQLAATVEQQSERLPPSHRGVRESVPTVEVEKARASTSRLERICAHLCEECQTEALRIERVQAGNASSSRLLLQEGKEAALLSEQLQGTRSELQATIQELQLAKENGERAGRERTAIENDVQACNLELKTYEQRCEVSRHEFSAQTRQLQEYESRYQALTNNVERARSDIVGQSRRLTAMQQQGSVVEADLSAISAELSKAKAEAALFEAEQQAEAQVAKSLVEEVAAAVAARRQEDEALARRKQAAADVEASLHRLRRSLHEADSSRRRGLEHVKSMEVQEKQHAASMTRLEQLLRQEEEDLAEVRSELRLSQDRHSLFAEEQHQQRSAGDALQARLRTLRSEVEDATADCRDLEEKLILKKADVEEEMWRQRQCRQEVLEAEGTLSKMKLHEATMEAEMRRASAAHAVASLRSPAATPTAEPTAREAPPQDAYGWRNARPLASPDGLGRALQLPEPAGWRREQADVVGRGRRGEPLEERHFGWSPSQGYR